MESVQTVRYTKHMVSRALVNRRGCWLGRETVRQADQTNVRLAPYASLAAHSRGRLRPETESPTRTPFQRDRDRILHATAFRRLTHKTQVFLYHEGDHYRTRLTHSLEVAQIARSIARTLKLDEDLAEAIALAHDLGHTPFGHAGERALDGAMAPYGGFDHNAQSLRIVTSLERKYASFDGLNLSWETLEGIVKHNGPLLDGAGQPVARYAESGVPQAITSYCEENDLELGTHAGPEAQVAGLADDIAYNNHDLDDGFRAGFLSADDLAEVPLAGPILQEVTRAHGALEGSRLIYEINRRLITLMIEDAVAETERRLAALAPSKAGDVRAAGQPIAAFSQATAEELSQLRAFLHARVYRHPRISGVMDKAQAIVVDLFKAYTGAPESLPEKWRGRIAAGKEEALQRHVADFIAGMTDRYAIGEHRRLFDDTPELR